MELIAEINRIFNADGTQAVEFESKTNAFRAIGVSSANLEGNEAPLSKQSAFGFDNAPASQTPVNASPVAPITAATAVETPVVPATSVTPEAPVMPAAPATSVAPEAPVMPAAPEVNVPVTETPTVPDQTQTVQTPAPEAPVQEALPAQEPAVPAQTEAPIAPVVEAPVAETPVAPTPVIENNNEQVTLGNDNLSQPTPAEQAEPEVLEDLSPKPADIKPAVINDVIEDRPVENADFESLIEYSFKPKEEVKEEAAEKPKEETPKVEEEVKPLEMPTVSDEIVAPEPTEINNELFNVNEINAAAPAVETPASEVPAAQEPALETMTDTPFVEAPLTNPVVETTEEVKVEDIPTLEANPVVENVPAPEVETVDIAPAVETEEPIIETAPANELETIQMDNEVKEEVPALESIPSLTEPVLQETEVKEEPVLQTIPTLTEEPTNNEVDNKVSENISNFDYEAVKEELINVIREDVEKVLNKYISNNHEENVIVDCSW